jgi:hypothetical protein
MKITITSGSHLLSFPRICIEGEVSTPAELLEWSKAVDEATIVKLKDYTEQESQDIPTSAVVETPKQQEPETPATPAPKASRPKKDKPATPAAPAVPEEPKPVKSASTDGQAVTFKEDTYWRHDDSDSLVVIKAGETVPNFGEELFQLTKEEYEEAAGIKLGDDGWVTLTRERYFYDPKSGVSSKNLIGDRMSLDVFQFMSEIREEDYKANLAAQEAAKKKDTVPAITKDDVQLALGKVKDAFGAAVVRKMLFDHGKEASNLSMVPQECYSTLLAVAEKELKANVKA